jgi:hypothetical protein
MKQWETKFFTSKYWTNTDLPPIVSGIGWILHAGKSSTTNILFAWMQCHQVKPTEVKSWTKIIAFSEAKPNELH